MALQTRDAPARKRIRPRFSSLRHNFHSGLLMLGLLNPWLLLGAALGALALAAGGFYEGVKHQQGVDARAALVVAQEQTKAVADASAKARMDQARADQITFDAMTAGAQAQTKIVTQTVNRLRDVPFFITPAAVAACPVSTGTVQLLDHAANGGGNDANPPVSTAPTSVDAPSGVGLDRVASTVVANYGTCHGWRQQVITWQEWYAKQAAAWPR